ncbi:ZIP family metal transporter [Steroidobacter agaridevorans]|uniref:ZIP family metal transporter n=1 Tax=Steroidobacter agaridevorans TaxID=2695856 RepID=A0A829Y743_9GAMM|nr:ZIP family metal transporter [Steroidobacter agaridevorans]GFE79084.1 ZIP family metal transporter [Steroidobacter agaridevorans]GFE88240.1 ZIP family metal transporter [Steroidobacter agaridevorans]
MHLLGWIILFTAIGGFLSALAASLFLVVPDRVRTRVLPHLVSFATGALLSAALLGLLPHAIESAGVSKTHEIGLTLLGGLLLFFVLEKMVLWRHCHADVCEVHVNPEPHAHAHGHGHNHAHHDHDQRRDRASATLILIGDGFHNVLDGVLIAAAFMTDVHLGVVTAMAVCAHEIPQEVGDLAILLNGGMGRLRALTLNLLTSITSVLGGVVAYFAMAQVQGVLPYVIAIAASSFLYIAVADLIPGLHRKVDPGSGVWQFLYIVLGVLVIYVSHSLAH